MTQTVFKEQTSPANEILLTGSIVPIRNTYKDSVFRLLFQDKKALLSLYNALNNTDYADENALEIEMLEHAIYMGVSDDVAFLLDCTLNIYEQQASINPNMPLRDLLYISGHFSKFTRDRSIYSSRLLKIPVPQFIVFYNGTREQPEKQILKLSDAYLLPTADPQLELKVTVFNINQGHNRELMEKCRTLQEYAIFVDTMRSFAQRYPIEEAARKAVDDCIQNHVLEDFLLSQRAEVIEMSIFEYNHELEMKKLRESEFQYGKDVGQESGKATGVIQMCQDFGLSRDETLKKLIEKLAVTEESAAQYLEQYWT